MEPWLITLLIVLAWEFLKFLGGILIPDAVQQYFSVKLEKVKYSISNRVDYKEITKTVLSANLTRALQAQLDLYRKLYELHFEWLYLDGELRKKRAKKPTIDRAYKDLVQRLDKARTEIFFNMIFAPEFFTFLLHAQDGLLDRTLFHWHRFENPRLSDENYKHHDHSAELDKAGKWLMERMHVSVTLDQVETFRQSNTVDVLQGDKGAVPAKKKK